jgi:tetratricopeptide (TPR) repeat protein
MARKNKKSSRRAADRSRSLLPNSLAIRWQEVALLVLIAAATVAAYWPAMHGEPLWDDASHMTRPELRSVTGLYRIWFDLGATQQYYPLLHSTFWLESKLWGEEPFGYHLLNVIFHVGVALLVFCVLRKLEVPGAMLAAAIFALHPVHVESVAWISEQKNTLSAIFYLSALLVYLRYDETRRWQDYALACALFLMGLLCKTVTATLPAAMLVIFWWKRGSISWRRDVLPLIPFFLVGAGAGLATAWVERRLIGAEGVDFELSIIQRAMLAGRAVWFYVGKLLLPWNLVFIYPRWTVDPRAWWQWSFPLSALAALVVLWAIRGRWRGPLAGTLFFVGTLFPVLGFLNVYPFLYSFVADHFQYLASLGIIVLVAAGAAIEISRLRAGPQLAAIVGCLAILGILAVLTWEQSQLYRDSLTLYEATIARNPACWMAHNNLGLTYARLGDSKRAIAHYEEVLRAKRDRAEVHNNLALELAKTGQIEDAIGHFEETIRLRPDYVAAYNNLGVIEARRGNSENSMKLFEQALSIDAEYAEARVHLGGMLRQLGRIDEATAQFQEAIRRNPRTAAAHNGYAVILLDATKFREALFPLHRAVELEPAYADARWNLATTLSRMGRYGEAIPHFQKLARLRPADPQVRLSLAQACALADRPLEARKAAAEAVALARASGDVATAEQIEAWMAGKPVEERAVRSVPGR